MYTPVNRKFMKDMDKTTLLKMREEQDMTNKEIALSVGCSEVTIRNIIGAMPPDMRRRKFSENGKRNALNNCFRGKDGYTAERTMMSFKPQREEPEPAKAVLVMKTLPPAPIPLHGAFMDYTISADRQTIEVENEMGRVLVCVPAEKLGTFIEELQAIEKNIAAEKPMPFWG